MTGTLIMSNYMPMFTSDPRAGRRAQDYSKSVLLPKFTLFIILNYLN